MKSYFFFLLQSLWVAINSSFITEPLQMRIRSHWASLKVKQKYLSELKWSGVLSATSYHLQVSLCLGG